VSDSPQSAEKSTARVSVRDALIALSLANLCYLRLWGEILAISSPDAYFVQITNADVAALILNVFLLAAAFLGATAIARRFGARGRVAIITGFVGVLLLQLNGLGPELAPGALQVIDRWKNGARLEALAPIVALLLIAAAAAKWPQRALKLTVGAVYFLAPFVLVTVGRGLWIITKVDATEALAAEVPAIDSTLTVADSAGPRVVVMVMDAMSRYHAVDARPDSIALPEFDQLRAEAIDATQAAQISPRTIVSVPTMLTGLDVERSAPFDSDELMLTVDSAQVPWSESETILDEAKELGGVAIVVGWYHPYCRMFEELDGCATFPTRTIGSRANETGFWRALVDQQLTLIPYINLRYRQIEIVESQREDALAAVTEGERGLVFLHLVVPHTPWIWDAAEDKYTLTLFHPDGYYGNLELMDKVLGELRAKMEAEGQWDSTAVLLLSDHIMRYRPKYLNEPNDARVPFILKMPGQRAGIVYDNPFNANVTHDLVTALLRGELKTAQDATRWLDGR
jgi:hypothetical protein